RSVTNTTVSLLWPVAVHMAVSGGTVLGLFGAEFGEAHAPLAVLAVGLGVAVTMGPGDMLVLMIGRSVRSLLNHLAAVVVDLLLIVLLVPAHGALGAAVAWAAAIVVMRILAVVEVWRA